ncbi:MAG: S8 family peptidase, partial [Bacteroidia bacterium]|nr:S8 family peptidase [Bacteroidia bacterium]
EYDWIRAAEFGDSVGTDIITSSLGYTTFDNSSYNHTYSMLDGKTLAISKAATMAARKGIFVCIAAGNEGASSWYYISAPSDADSVCTVGAVDASGNVASFSGKGPTSNGRIKPDVCARGVSTAIAAPNGTVFTANGTSFATPLIAGAVACLWQAKPNLTNIQLLNLIKQFSSNSSNPNNNMGWGIPDFCGAYTTINNLEVSQSVKIFPNPTSNNIYLKTYQVMNKITMFDVLGHVLLIKNVKDVSEMIDLSDIKNGIYFITIEFENGNIFNTKIIKY